MFGLIGIVVIFVMVFGGYLLAGGKLGIILKSLPFEMMMIGGAAIGAFLISNSGEHDNNNTNTSINGNDDKHATTNNCPFDIIATYIPPE